jgi:type I restriction enzyme S subunit
MKIDNYKLGDLLVKIIDNRGKTPPYSGEGDVELIETASLVGNNKFPDYNLVTKYVDQDTFNTWFRSGHPIKDDILIATVGVNIGNVVIMRENRGCIAQNLVGFRPNIKIISPHFLYYFLSWDRTQAYLKKLDIGSAQPSIKVPHLLHVKIPCPVMMIQRKIAAILSAYDDLIENNTRRIKILEEMAQAIYNEWFVKFRFPGHEKVKMVDSELGKIPEGWEVKVLNEITTYQGGSQPPKTEHIYEPRRGYVRFIQNRDYSSDQHPTFIKIDRRNRTCTEYDIMIDKYGEVGKIRFGLEGAYNVALAKIEPVLTNTREYIRGYLNQEKVRQYLNNASGASTRGSLNKSHFNLKIVVPQSKLLSDYEIFSKTIISLILSYRRKNKILRQTRDLLLPKLMSGEIDVENLDIKVDNEQ